MSDDLRTTSRRRSIRRYAVWILVVPLGILAVLSVFGALHGAFEQDCQVGFYTACGPGMKAAAYAVFLGFPLLAVYYLVLALVGAFRFLGWAVGLRSDEASR